MVTIVTNIPHDINIFLLRKKEISFLKTTVRIQNVSYDELSQVFNCVLRGEIGFKHMHMVLNDEASNPDCRHFVL